MDRVKIKYYVDNYAECVGMNDGIKKIVIELMENIISKYEKIVPCIPVEKDNLDTYIIKPVNGKYSVEDFFLNRLMRNILSVEILGSLSSSFDSRIDSSLKACYDSSDSKVQFNPNNIDHQLDKYKRLFDSEEKFRRMSNIAIKKVIMHEFLHGLQTKYQGVQWYVFDKYKKLADKLSRENRYNKHATSSELDKINRRYGSLHFLTAGVMEYDSSRDKKRTYRDNESAIEAFDEALNESESLEMAGQVYSIPYTDGYGNRYDCRNPESYSSYTANLGALFKLTFGQINSFEMMYFNPVKKFDIFNTLFKDIFQAEYKTDKEPIRIVMESLDKIRYNNNIQEVLRLNNVFARCLEKRIKHILTVENPKYDSILEQINQFKKLSISNKYKKLEYEDIINRLVNIVQDQKRRKSSDFSNIMRDYNRTINGNNNNNSYSK